MDAWTFSELFAEAENDVFCDVPGEGTDTVFGDVLADCGNAAFGDVFPSNPGTWHKREFARRLLSLLLISSSRLPQGSLYPFVEPVADVYPLSSRGREKYKLIIHLPVL